MSETIGLTSAWRKDFPTLHQDVNGSPLVYLDTAATAQTPQVVIDRMTQFYQHEYATVHRGVHTLSAKVTDAMENVRALVAKFLGAKTSDSIIFTKGTTEAINLVANSYLKPNVSHGDEIIVTELEHHANLVPWQMVAEACGLKVKVWTIDKDGNLDIEQLRTLITRQTRLLAVTHVSNVIGTHNDIKAIVKYAHRRRVPVLVDGAQAVSHCSVDVQDLDCDFYVFSGHKLYGPTGSGVLYAKSERLEIMPPWEGGGSMIDQVTLPMGTTYGSVPWRFELVRQI